MLTNHRVAKIFLLLSIVLAGLCLIESHTITIPYFFADEWLVSSLVSSSSFVDAVRVGHNGVPSYFQNALWWVDYHWLNARGVLPRWFQDGIWVLNVIVFYRVIRRAGLSTTSASWITALLISLWFTHANRAHYFHYVWRGFETSLAFLLISISLLFLLQFRSRQLIPATHGSFAPVAGALLFTWLALYMHGGFAILPIIALSIVLLRPKRSVIIAVAVVLVIFLWHYKTVHYQPDELATSAVPFLELAFAYALIIASIPYQMVVTMAGPMAAAAVAIIIILLFTAAMFRTGLRLLRGQSTPLDLVAFVLMSYPAILALGAVIVRAREHGWEYVLAPRYSNFSVYVLMGFSLLLCQRREMLSDFKWRPWLRTAGIGALAIVGIFSWHGIYRALREAPVLRNHCETYMIPLTLDPWTLPPSPVTSARRIQAAGEIQADLLADGKSVFGSESYRQYSISDHTPTDLPSLPEEIARITLVRSATTNRGKLAQLSIAWPSRHSASSHLCIFVSGDRKAGWALPVNRGMNLFSSEPNEAMGYATLVDGREEVFAVLVNEQGQWQCRSASIHVP